MYIYVVSSYSPDAYTVKLLHLAVVENCGNKKIRTADFSIIFLLYFIVLNQQCLEFLAMLDVNKQKVVQENMSLNRSDITDITGLEVSANCVFQNGWFKDVQKSAF